MKMDVPVKNPKVPYLSGKLFSAWSTFKQLRDSIQISSTEKFSKRPAHRFRRPINAVFLIRQFELGRG